MEPVHPERLKLETRDPTRLFQELMRFRVREILLVSSLYGSFTLSEDGSLYESLLNEYLGLGLTHMPNLTRVSSGEEALALAGESGRFDLIICSLRLEDMHAVELVQCLREGGVGAPVVLLTYDSRELASLVQGGGAAVFDRVFMWQGDFRVLLAIIHSVEDRANLESDTALAGVQSVILIEDDVRFYSSYLPLFYTAVFEHTADLIAEGVNPAHRLLRMRARPKIILCGNYEEAWRYFERYHETILGVVCDIEFPRGGAVDPEAGFGFARSVIESHGDIPVLLQSHDAACRARAERAGASFLRKDSPTLLGDLKEYMVEYFGFGDFVFRRSGGAEVARAADLRTLEEELRTVPDECIAHHGQRNDFSRWLKARTEFDLAHRLRPVKVSDYSSIEEVRAHLVTSIQAHRRERQRGKVVDFDRDSFDPARSFARIGGGSLGGKGRGLAFANALLADAARGEQAGVRIAVPPSVVLGTEVFDRFLELNDLRGFAIHADDDGEILGRFLKARFPEDDANALRAYLDSADYPLSVRSSSLLEDSQFMPFAGVYETFMLPNNHRDPGVRLGELLDGVRRVYASTFFQSAKSYLRSTPYRLEEEKMAVIVQKLVGTPHGDRYYPDFSGVARSYNFYPTAPMTPDDGIAVVAIGLGKQVMDGGATVRFCPRYPRHVMQFADVEEGVQYSQRTFYALGLPDPGIARDRRESARLVVEDLERAEKDGVLAAVGSTYSRENHAIYDDISREGLRVVTFAPILKNDRFPLSQIIERQLDLGRRGMSGPVEIEFAVNLKSGPGGAAEFHLLQLRPMVIDREVERLSVTEVPREALVCHSTQALGHGASEDIRDLVVIDPGRFERADSPRVAREVGRLNAMLAEQGRPYVLISVGRLGSADPWLGVPVRWDEISGARTIVEAPLRDIRVAPSQGGHFFQNLAASQIGFLTVGERDVDGFVDWDWLARQPAQYEGPFVRLLRFEQPLCVFVDGQRSRGLVMKPGAGRA
jgi:CheY-like chemotaxis protein